jgi:uncharacterized lipoprotein YbaY
LVDAQRADGVNAVVTGQVVIAASVAAFAAGVVHVRLEDVSYADAAARLIAETIVSGVTHDPAQSRDGQTAIAFRLTVVEEIDPGHDYSVRVWLDRDGDGKPGSGDVWSDESYPVLTRGFGTEVTIVLGRK